MVVALNPMRPVAMPSSEEYVEIDAVGKKKGRGIEGGVTAMKNEGGGNLVLCGSSAVRTKCRMVSADGKVVANLGSSDIDSHLEELLTDGIVYVFQEQTSDDTNVMFNGFAVVVNELGPRVKPYLPEICGTIKWRLNNKSATTKQLAVDLISRIVVVLENKLRVASLAYDFDLGHGIFYVSVFKVGDDAFKGSSLDGGVYFEPAESSVSGCGLMGKFVPKKKRCFSLQFDLENINSDCSHIEFGKSLNLQWTSLQYEN